MACDYAALVQHGCLSDRMIYIKFFTLVKVTVRVNGLWLEMRVENVPTKT